MSNNRQKRRKMHQKVDNIPSSFSYEFSRVLKILVVIVLVLVIFYFLTVYILNKGDDFTIGDTTPAEANIQYQEILAGNSFSMKNSHYYVLYYDMTSDELKSTYTNIISTYEDQEEHYPIYTVDMHSVFNKKYVSNSSNKEVETIDELMVSGPTLIEFENGKVKKYIEGQDSIQEELS